MDLVGFRLLGETSFQEKTRTYNSSRAREMERERKGDAHRPSMPG